MEKNFLRQLEALVNSFIFYPKRFFQKTTLSGAMAKKTIFLREITHPLLDRKVKLGPKFFHGYLSWD